MEMSAETVEELVRMEREMAPRLELAHKLKEQDPELSFVSAVTIAGDRLSLQRSIDWVENLEMSFLEALPFVGSFGRMDFILWGWQRELIDTSWLVANICDYWRGSDPDDGNIDLARLWQIAYEANGYNTLTDSTAGLPYKPFNIYRGQMPLQPLGIAWSLSRDVARKFANGAGTRQFTRNGFVVQTRIHPEEAIAYMVERKEEEVIYFPKLHGNPDSWWWGPSSTSPEAQDD